jgi:membrane protein implicated in regulation of membrane protease activity
MSQTRRMSFMEAATSVAAGFLLSLGMQVVLFPAVGLQTTLAQNLKLALGFTVLSLVRSYAVRRVFEYLGRSRTPGGGSISNEINALTGRPGICTHGHNSNRGAKAGE